MGRRKLIINNRPIVLQILLSKEEVEFIKKASELRCLKKAVWALYILLERAKEVLTQAPTQKRRAVEVLDTEMDTYMDTKDSAGKSK